MIVFQNSANAQVSRFVDGNGQHIFTAQELEPILSDPGLQDLIVFAVEFWGNGMQNASMTVSLDIIYPGLSAISFPTILDVNTCLIGTPLKINCDCQMLPCTEVGDVNLSMYRFAVSDSIVTTGMISVSDQVSIGSGANIFWQSNSSVLIEGSFEVGLGSELIVNMDDCTSNN